jgi:uncharacterized protein (TIGR02145 family)
MHYDSIGRILQHHSLNILAMQKIERLSYVIIPVFLILCSCKKDNGNIPIVSTSEVVGITSNWAICGGNITNDGGAEITERGVCFGTSEMPTISDQKSPSGSGAGGFTCNLKGLTGNTKYYIAAYATNSSGTGYGEINSFTTPATVTDIDGNSYSTVVIGTQTWMAENLKVTHYRNNEPITNETNFENWQTQQTGFYCDYEDDENNGNIYGHLYNWYAVSDNRNLSPEGWHVPSHEELTILIDYLGGASVAGEKLRETGYVHWLMELNGLSLPQGTNTSGFTAIAAGYLNPTGKFYGDLKWNTTFWSSTNQTERYTYSLTIDKANGVYLASSDKNPGFSIRCIKN